MVTRDGLVKILDFGLAKLTSTGPGQRRGLGSADDDRDHARRRRRHGRLHVAGAGERRGGRLPLGPVLLRLGALRDGDREARLPEGDGRRHAGRDPEHGARADRAAQSRRSRRLCAGSSSAASPRTRTTATPRRRTSPASWPTMRDHLVGSVVTGDDRPASFGSRGSFAAVPRPCRARRRDLGRQVALERAAAFDPTISSNSRLARRRSRRPGSPPMGRRWSMASTRGTNRSSSFRRGWAPRVAPTGTEGGHPFDLVLRRDGDRAGGRTVRARSPWRPWRAARLGSSWRTCSAPTGAPDGKGLAVIHRSGSEGRAWNSRSETSSSSRRDFDGSPRFSRDGDRILPSGGDSLVVVEAQDERRSHGTVRQDWRVWGPLVYGLLEAMRSGVRRSGSHRDRDCERSGRAGRSASSPLFRARGSCRTSRRTVGSWSSADPGERDDGRLPPASRAKTALCPG